MEVFPLLLWTLLGYAGLGVLYGLFFSSSAFFYRKDHGQAPTTDYSKMAVFIPGYMEDQVIISTAKSALNQKYPKAFYDVIVIADSFSDTTINELRKMPISVEKVSFKNSSKARSLNKVLGRIKKEYDLALVLDADNHMNEDVLVRINKAFQQGHKSIQCHRVAKNMDSPTSILDGLAEEINNSIWRKGHVAVGLSSAISGSGMAIQYELFKDCMSGIDAFSGFDKELEVHLLFRKIHTTYLDDAHVLDEKVRQNKVLQKQRARWFASQLSAAKKYFWFGWKELILKGNFDLFNKTVQFILFPRILSLFTILSILVYSVFFGYTELIISSCSILSLFTITMAIATPREYFSLSTLRSLSHLPTIILALLKSVLLMKTAKSKFLNTTHEESH